MSNTFKQGTGGASIIPSARPSIHNHWQCPFGIESKMTRYGMNRGNQESDSEQGADEVDNAMSKLSHPIRPPSRQNKNKSHRRNSLSLESKTNQYTEDDNSNVLSKSVPATLPSRLYCSDDSEDEAPRNEQQFSGQFSDVSFHSYGSPNRSNVSRSGSYSSSPILERESARNIAKDQRPTQKSSSIITVLSIVCVLVTVCANMLNTSDSSNTSIYDEFKFYTDVSGIGEKYNINENSILQVQTGVSTIFKKHDTGSFMFVYNSDTNKFNPSEFNKFVNDVSFASSKYLRNDSTPVHYTMVEGTKLDMGEHSELISRYREDLHRTGVMLVRHIEDIPSDLAMAFHYYCDEYNPLVKKSAIFFTLNLAKCPQETDKKSIHALIEKCLMKKWSSVPIDSIGPLLTRVVSVVIDVTNAF